MSTRSRSLLFSFCCLTTLGATLGAAPNFVVAARAFVPSPLFDSTRLSLRVLPNGVRSIVRSAPGSGIVAVQVWVRAGSRHEFADQGGAAHLLGVAAMKASSRYALRDGGATTAIQALGGTSFAQTSRDSTNFSVTVSKNFAGDALRVLADATLRPNFSPAAFSADKDDARFDIQAREGDALSVVSDFSYAGAFAKHPYRRSPFGQISALEQLSVAKLRAFHLEHYTGANISVVIVGDIDTERAHALVAQNFADAPIAAANARNTFGALEAAPNKPRTLQRVGNVARPTVAVSFRAPGFDSPEDVVAMDVLIAHWNEGRGAQMRHVLLGESVNNADESENPDAETSRDNNQTAPKSPLALGLDIAFLTQRDPSLVTFTMVTEKGATTPALKALFEEIANVQKNSLTMLQLDRAKRALRRQYVAQDETASGQAGALGFYDMIDSYDFAATYTNRVNRVSLADIKRVAARYFVPSSSVAVLLSPQNPTQSPQNSDEGGVDA